MKSYFFDSYAFFEIFEGSEAYKKFLECNLVTTKLNLMEVHYGVLIRKGGKLADEVFEELTQYTVEIDDFIIKEANKFREKHKGLSYVDCIGYIFAKRIAIQFLTGDEHFRDLDNVEFVK